MPSLGLLHLLYVLRQPRLRVLKSLAHIMEAIGTIRTLELLELSLKCANACTHRIGRLSELALLLRSGAMRGMRRRCSCLQVGAPFFKSLRMEDKTTAFAGSTFSK